MNRTNLIRIGIFSALLVSASEAFSQTATSSPPQQDRADVNARIIYTGKLLGYFRAPSWQSKTAYRCPDNPRAESGRDMASEPAFRFLQLRREDQRAILVGTGDNFSPQLEARVFEPPPAGGGGTYVPGNKELFNWDGSAWIPYDQTPKALRDRLSHGLGTIPNDNVGCFLAAAKYAAIVPGKHDFYFGADRVRQFARFMAGIENSAEYAPVQMLGANLVLKTVPISDTPPLPREITPPAFKTNWPKEYAVLNLQDNSSVYPWFSYAKINLVALKLDAPRLNFLRNWFSNEGLVSDARSKSSSAPCVMRSSQSFSPVSPRRWKVSQELPSIAAPPRVIRTKSLIRLRTNAHSSQRNWLD